MLRKNRRPKKRRASASTPSRTPDTRSLEEASAPRKHPVALVLVDVLNPMDFPEGPALLRQALPAAKRIARLKKRLKARGIPTIYVNDNFGLWRSEKWDVVAQATHENATGSAVARLLLPDDDDFFVLKPKNSGFFSTTLDTLLNHLGSRHLVLVGLSANICLLHTAFDAHARGYRLSLPSDCVAANDRRAARNALRLCETALQASTLPSEKLNLSRSESHR